MARCPLLYVRGNHDRRYTQEPPEGCIDIDDKIYDYKGLRILGLGGSMRYHDGSDMYTESEMKKRVGKLKSYIALRNGIDILVTHAPAKGYGDQEDLPHRGFETCCIPGSPNTWCMAISTELTAATSFRRSIIHLEPRSSMLIVPTIWISQMMIIRNRVRQVRLCMISIWECSS